jgi:hypothetical protein
MDRRRPRAVGPLHRWDEAICKSPGQWGVVGAGGVDLRPLPCQQNTRNRCARRCSRRSASTVDAQGKRSLGDQGNALFRPISATTLVTASLSLVARPAPPGHCGGGKVASCDCSCAARHRLPAPQVRVVELRGPTAGPSGCPGHGDMATSVVLLKCFDVRTAAVDMLAHALERVDRGGPPARQAGRGGCPVPAVR